MKVRRLAAIPVVGALAVGGAMIATSSDAAPTVYESPVGWTTQFGVADAELRPVEVLRASSGDVYIVGGIETISTSDIYIAKFDKNGNRLWLKTYGAPGVATAPHAAALSSSGDIYVAGVVNGDLDGPGQGSFGGYDGFLMRVDKSGVRKWTRHVGSTEYDEFNALAVAGSNDIYVAGTTDGVAQPGGPPNDPFNASDLVVARYDRSGNQKWLRQLGGSSIESATAIVVRGSSEIYVGGWTGSDLDGAGDGPFGSRDAFLMRVDKNGNVTWTRQLGSPQFDVVTAITTYGSKEVYVGGSTLGDMDGPLPGTHDGDTDPWFARYDRDGTRAWMRQPGSSETDAVTSIAVASSSVLYVSGETDGDMDGSGPFVPDHYDLYVSSFSSTTGADRSVQQFGTAANDFGGQMVLTSTKRPLIVGSSSDPLWGHTSNGGVQTFAMVLPA